MPRNPITSYSMVKSENSKFVPRHICRSIQDIACLGVRNKEIARYYKLKPSSVSSIIRFSKSKIIQKETGRKEILSALGIRML